MKLITWIVVVFLVFLAFFTGLITMWIVSIAQRENEATSLMSGREKISRAAPNSSVVAFVWLPDISGSIMVSQPYQVWIESKKPTEKRLVLEADKTDSISLAWRGSSLLEICYSDAQITQFKNRFVAIEQDFPEVREVEIVLRKVQRVSDCGA